MGPVMRRVMRGLALAAAIVTGAPGAMADDLDPALVDRLFAATLVERHLARARDDIIGGWVETDFDLMNGSGGAEWDRLAEAENSPERIAADFRAGFLAAGLSQAHLAEAVEVFSSPFGQTLSERRLAAEPAVTDWQSAFPQAYAAANETGDPGLAVSDEVMALLAIVDHRVATIREGRRGFYAAMEAGGGLLPHEPDLETHMADYDRILPLLREGEVGLWRQIFFHIGQDFDATERAAWLALAGSDWGQAHEAAFQAGLRNVRLQAGIRMGAATAAALLERRG